MPMSRQLPRWGTILKIAIIVCTMGYCVLLCSWSVRNNDDTGRSDKAVVVDDGQALPQFIPNLGHAILHIAPNNDDAKTEEPKISHDVGHDDMDDRLDLRPKPGLTLDFRSMIQRLRSNSTSWRFRRDNLLKLRKQIKDFLGRDFLNSAFLTRDNTPLNSSVLFYKILPEGVLPVVHDLWVQLPKAPVYSGRQYKTCSVVGSSGILTGSKCGRFIDSTEFVFRMNNAPTSDDFMVDVGKRTNQMSETGKSLAKVSLNASETFNLSCLPSTPFPDKLFQDTSKPLPKILLVRLPTFPETDLVRLITRGCRVVPKGEGQLVLWDSRINVKMNDFWRQNGLKLKMSSGFFSITLALHLCREIHVFGFWPFSLSSERKAVPYHYHDLLITTKVIHNFIEEFDLLVRLHEHGLIKLHVDDCTQERMGSSSVPLVLYIFVKSSVQDTRQRIHENVQNVGVAFPKVDFRVHRFESNRVFDDMLDLFLKGISESDVSRLQGIIVNGFGQNPTGALGDTEFSGAFFKMVLLAMLRRRSNSSQRIAVVCAQSFSHTFTQHADSIPAESSGVFQFFPLTTSYQPYQVKPDAMARPVGLSLDFQKLIGHVFQSPSGNGFRRHNETMLGVSSIVRSDHF